MGAVTTILTVVLGKTLYDVKSQPPKPGTSDSLQVALGDNTRAINAMHETFGRNIKLFEESNQGLKLIFEEIKDTNRIGRAKLEHLSALRDAMNRSRRG